MTGLLDPSTQALMRSVLQESARVPFDPEALLASIQAEAAHTTVNAPSDSPLVAHSVAATNTVARAAWIKFGVGIVGLSAASLFVGRMRGSEHAVRPPTAAAVMAVPAPVVVGRLPTAASAPSPSEHSVVPRASNPVVAARSVRVSRVDPLRMELSALDRAQLAMRAGNAETALLILRPYQSPSSQLWPELALARVRALCATGQVAAARDVARALQDRSPRVSLLAQLGTTCVRSADVR